MTHFGTKQVISYYYEHIYNKIWSSNPILSIAERFMESTFSASSKNRLEIGGGVGQHLKYVKNWPSSSYVLLDPISPKKIVKSELISKYAGLQFVKASAENIPFKDNFFDQLLSTCVLAHVQDPLQVCKEIKRIIQIGGEIVILLPTDPGFFNLLTKKFFTYPKINSISRYPADLIYALDHRNSINNLLSIIKYVFKDDQLKLYFMPFFIKSVNFNLLCIVKIKVLTK
jgi:ubiquinone/menaquinone biosynthesis C-methylase UbiE